jgi:hypothetical protein
MGTGCFLKEMLGMLTSDPGSTAQVYSDGRGSLIFGEGVYDGVYTWE